MKTIYKNPLFWVIIVSILPVLSLLHTGLPITHDGQDHVARIANFYLALKDGILIPRWAGSLNWGYGHPILMFLYPLPSYIASAFHSIGFSLVDSTKLVFAFSFVASGITMFLWMNASWGPVAGFVGALLYEFAPYRFVDLYVRGAIGEHVAFIFPPLVLYSLLKKKWVGVSLSLAALILSHNAISIMFLPVIGLYALYLLFLEKKKLPYVLKTIVFTALGFSLAAFFWIPALIEGKFTLRDIVTAGQAKEFVPWTWFLYSPWTYGIGSVITKSLGIPQWIGIMFSLWLVARTKDKNLRTVLLVALVILLMSLFIMSSTSVLIWKYVTLLEKFQFPWRFLSVSVFMSAVIGGIGISRVIPKKNTLLILFCLFIVVSTIYMWRPKGYSLQNDSFYSGIFLGTTDTGESSPIWSVRFMEHTPANHLDVGQGDVSVTEGKHTTTIHEYVLNVRKPSLMVENTLYFPNWMIYINGIPTGIEWQNPDYRGLMTFRVTPGENQTVRVVFEDTKVRKTANLISLVSIVLIVGAGIRNLVWKRKR